MPGVGLTEPGLEQARTLAETLKNHAIHAIYSSPLERARATASPLAAARDLPIRIEPGLNEVEFGDWTGLTFEELERRDDWQAFNARRGAAHIPGGESPAASQARIVATLGGIQLAHPGETVVAITHADMIRYALLHAAGAPLDDVHTIKVPPASAHAFILNLRE